MGDFHGLLCRSNRGTTDIHTLQWQTPGRYVSMDDAVRVSHRIAQVENKYVIEWVFHFN